MEPPRATADERQLIVRSQRGDKTAYGELVKQYRLLLLSISYRLSGDPELAEDATQEAFLRAWQHLPGFELKQPGGFRAWLCRIVTNVTIDELRRQRPRVPLEALDLPDGTQPDSEYIRRERAEVVQAAIATLPERSRAALVLREYGQLSYQEIADALNIPIGTVMSRLNYARRQLRTLLEPYLVP